MTLREAVKGTVGKESVSARLKPVTTEGKTPNGNPSKHWVHRCMIGAEKGPIYFLVALKNSRLRPPYSGAVSLLCFFPSQLPVISTVSCHALTLNGAGERGVVGAETSSRVHRIVADSV